MAQEEITESTQNTETQVASTGTANQPTNSKILKIAVIAVVLVAAAVGLYLVFGTEDKPSNQPSSAIQTTTDVVVPGSSKGKGMSFSRPTELSSVSWQDTNNLRSFIKLSPSTKQEAYIDISRLMASSVNYTSSSGPTPEYFDAVEATLKDPNSPDYSNNISFLTNFVKQGFTEGPIAVSLGVAKPFTNPTIKKNAWIFDVTTVDSSNITPSHRGVLVYALGENAVYRFMYTKTTAQWNAENSSQQAVLNSIKVDQ